MARIINWVPFHWAQSAWQQPHYPVDNWSVLPFISILNAIKCHYWLSNLPSALGSGCLLRRASASQIRGECSVRCSQRPGSHHTLIISTSLFSAPPPCPRMLHNSRAGYLSRSREGVTFYRAEWKGELRGYYLGGGGGARPHEII